jgi:peptide chain release factor 1
VARLRPLAQDCLTLLADLEVAARDPELTPLRAELEEALQAAAQRLQEELAPPEDLTEARLIVEVRQGVGGDEAALWAAQVARLLRRYAERRGFAVEDLYRSESKGGGIKEEVFSVAGAGALALLDETGVHRVQRVSPTDSRGRVHTSAATVAVLEEAGTDAPLDITEVAVTTFHASGNGGQNVNKVETAVRAIHRPTGITVSMQDERTQGRNREKALRVLAARVTARLKAARESVETETRRTQLGSGDRSQKRRTYDFPEGIVVDHLRGVKTSRLAAVLDGDLDLLRPPG